MVHMVVQVIRRPAGRHSTAGCAERSRVGSRAHQPDNGASVVIIMQSLTMTASSTHVPPMTARPFGNVDARPLHRRFTTNVSEVKSR
jgi:hypothetical protein